MYKNRGTKTSSIISLIIFLFFALNYASSQIISKPTGKVICWHYKKQLLPTCDDEPGWYLYNPLTTEPEIVDVVLQIDTLGPYECRNKDNELVIWPKIEVSNQLRKDKVVPVLTNFEKYFDSVFYDDILIKEPVMNWVYEQCTKYTGDELQTTEYSNLNEKLREYLISYQSLHKHSLNGEDTGIIFPELGVLIMQPRLHPDVERERQKVAQFKAEQLSKEASRKVQIIQEETDKQLKLIRAMSERQEAEIVNKKEIDYAESTSKKMKIEAESQAEQAKIFAQSQTNTIKEMAEAKNYADTKQAESNNKLFGSPEAYVQVLIAQSFSNGTKVYWGDKLPLLGMNNP